MQGCFLQRAHLALKTSKWITGQPVWALPRRTIAQASMAEGSKVFAINDRARLVLSQGDITKWEGDAIVNAAIHRAAGKELLKACQHVPTVRPGVRCPTGDARITPGFSLPAKHVIHTVGPIYESAAESAPLLASAYTESLKLANANGLRTVAFPAISCGVFGYPLQEAAEVSLKAVQSSVGDLEEVHFVLFGMPTFSAYVEQAVKLFGEQENLRDEL